MRDTVSERIRQLRQSVKFKRSKWATLYCGLSNDDGEYPDDIPGLCPNQDSCEQCREARMADPGYQWYLRRKWFLEALKSRAATLSDLESRAEGDEQVANILSQLNDMYEQGLKAYAELVSNR